MLLRRLSSVTCGIVADYKQKHMSSTNKCIDVQITCRILPLESSTNEVIQGNQGSQPQKYRWLKISFVTHNLCKLGNENWAEMLLIHIIYPSHMVLVSWTMKKSRPTLYFSKKNVKDTVFSQKFPLTFKKVNIVWFQHWKDTVRGWLTCTCSHVLPLESL